MKMRMLSALIIGLLLGGTGNAQLELAQHHGIKVILCSLLPVSDYTFSQLLRTKEAG